MLTCSFKAALCRVHLIAFFAASLTFGGAAEAVRVNVVVADDAAAQSEFVHQLRQLHQREPNDGRLGVVQLSAWGAAASNDASAQPDTDSVTRGVRTRSVRSRAAFDQDLTLAVGARAARAAIERPGNGPLLLTMLSLVDYESLKADPGLGPTHRRIGVLLRDPAMGEQLWLVDRLLPTKRRLSIVATPESAPLVRELERAANGWNLKIEYAPDAMSLAAALRAVVPQSDALMVLPDLIGDNQAATLAVLRAGASAGLPVFGASDGMVRSGGLAAVISTPSQLAQQALALSRKLVGASQEPLVESAIPMEVRINSTVARQLGLRLPDERELDAQLPRKR